MGYAASGYCFQTGPEATAALTAAQQAKVLNTTKTGECPLVWNGSGYANQATYNTTTHACTASATRVYFASCTEPGPLAPSVIPDPIGDSTAFFAIAFVFLASIWALKKLYSIFNKEA